MKMTVARHENIKEVENAFGEKDIELINPEEFGYFVKSHVVPHTQADESGQLQMGISVMIEVAWNHKRCPAIELLAPQDLYWIAFVPEDAEAGEEDIDEPEEESTTYENEPELLT